MKVLVQEPAEAWTGGLPHHSLIYPLWDILGAHLDGEKDIIEGNEALFKDVHQFLLENVPMTFKKVDQ